MSLVAPFPWFGGKRDIAALVWQRFGQVKQYVEPFCGSAAVLLAAKSPAPLEVIGDVNGFVANFWRAVKHQADNVAREADYPVSHIDLGARHVWLLEQRQRIGAHLQDACWPGDARVAGWWLWGQCAWIGSGWCEWEKALGQIPHVSNAGRGVQALGQIPHVSSAGQGVQALGQIPHVSDAGRGVQALGKIPHVSSAGQGVAWTSAGRVAWEWLHRLSERLERVRVIHGEWSRCLNNHYGGESTAVFLDPPYLDFEDPYGNVERGVAREVEEWARANSGLRICLCGHDGDYDLPGWERQPWSRSGATYGSAKTKDLEMIWWSPSCLTSRQASLFDGLAP